MTALIAGIVATLAGGLFAGAALYVTLVEHPARLSTGAPSALAEWRPSYERGAALQAPLAVVGGLAALLAFWQGGGSFWLAGGLLLGSLVPYTLLVIWGTNAELKSHELDPASPRATELLVRWGRLHAVRTVVGLVAFGLFLAGLAGQRT